MSNSRDVKTNIFSYWDGPRLLAIYDLGWLTIWTPDRGREVIHLGTWRRPDVHDIVRLHHPRVRFHETIG